MSQLQFSEQKGYYSESGPGREVFEAEINTDIADILRGRSRSLDTERREIVRFYDEFNAELKLRQASKRGDWGVRAQTVDDEINFGLKELSGLERGLPILAAEGSPYLLVPDGEDLSFTHVVPPGLEIRGQIGEVRTYRFTQSITVYKPDDSMIVRRVRTEEACMKLNGAVMVDGDGEMFDIAKSSTVLLRLHSPSLDLYEGVVYEPGTYDEPHIWAQYIKHRKSPVQD
jgi:hypothetical protein